MNKGRRIAPEEKLYSILEQHTEWVQKGKSRPDVELGHRLLITTDQYGLEHHSLDRYPEKGYQSYARYAGLGILAYNLHRLAEAQRLGRVEVEDGCPSIQR